MYELPIKISHQKFYQNYDSTYFYQKTDQTIWYSLFTSIIEAIIEKYNKDNNESETIEEIDEDKLCQVILTMAGIKLRVSSTNTVLSISFT